VSWVNGAARQCKFSGRLKEPVVPENAASFAASTVGKVRRIAQIELDYSVGSLEHLEVLLGQFHSDQVSVNDAAITLFCFGRYVGEVPLPLRFFVHSLFSSSRPQPSLNQRFASSAGWPGAQDRLPAIRQKDPKRYLPGAVQRHLVKRKAGDYRTAQRITDRDDFLSLWISSEIHTELSTSRRGVEKRLFLFR
jgi:hypothetical protein